jgi:hypothetical protein
MLNNDKCKLIYNHTNIPLTNDQHTNQHTKKHILDYSQKFITDGGCETHMLFRIGHELRNFALFECLNDEKGRRQLYEMYSIYHCHRNRT